MRTHWLIAPALACLTACGASYDGLRFPKVYENMDATQRIDVLPNSHGTAVVLTTDGYLLTCFHVSEKGGNPLILNIAEGDRPAVAYPAVVVATDEKHDLALLKVERRFERTAVLAGENDVHALDAVYNIGYPYDLGRLASRGDVKSVAWNFEDADDPGLKIENGLVLDIANGPGTSGSGIFLARDGRLIGLMQLSFQYGPRGHDGRPVIDGRQVNLHVAISIDVIRAFLDSHHVRYHVEFPEVEAGQGRQAA
jgi:S1-C subfamily serine protease